MANPVPVTKWNVGEDFVSKVFLPPFVRYNSELTPSYRANGLNREYYITLRRSAQAFGLNMMSDIYHREMNDIEFTKDNSAVGMIRLSLDEKTGKTGQIELFSLPFSSRFTP